MIRILVVFSVFYTATSFAKQATKRQALRALDSAYSDVLESEEQLNYQAIINMATEISSMTEGGSLLCSHSGGGWYHLVDRREDKRLSKSSMKLDVCEAVLKNARLGMVCSHTGGGWFHLYDQRSSTKLTTSSDSLQNCTAAIQDSRKGLVCTHTGGGWYHLYDRIGKKRISRNSMPYGECVRSI